LDNVPVTSEAHHIQGEIEQRLSSGKKKHGILRPV
jgi:hypothetical protein